jgi:transcriptional regulator with XRE-family HTH domain
VSAKKRIVTDEGIGALVRARRHKQGLGQPELGEALGVSGMTVQHYETGRTPLTVVKLVKIAEVLRCRTLDLIP